MATKIYPNQILVIELDCATDISGALNPRIAVQKPDGSTAEWSAAVGGDNQSIVYTTQAGDLDQIGYYRLQALPGLSTGFAPGATASLRVVSLYG